MTSPLNVLLLGSGGREHAIAVHRLVQVGPGHVQVAAHALERAVGHDEPVALLRHLQPARHQVHALRQAQLPSARLHERARGHEVLQLSPDGRALLAPDAQHPQQFGRGGRVSDAGADQIEQVGGSGHRE